MHFLHCCDATICLLQCTPEAYVLVRFERGILPRIQKVKAMILTHLVRAYQQWKRYNSSLRELSRLGDRELADIGISRGDIPRVAWEASER